MTTQKNYLLKYMQERRNAWISITEFIGIGIYRYGARIWELRKEGYKIEMRAKVVKHPLFKNQRQIDYRLLS